MMSVIHFLPRIASWRNLYDKKSPSPIREEGDNIQDLIAQIQSHNNGFQRGPARKKISYWSEDDRSISEIQRHINRHSGTRQKARRTNNDGPEFVTSWRPQTTFGYKDDFDLARHQQETRRRVGYLQSQHPKQHLFRYDSYPQIIRRSKKASPGVRLQPLEQDKKRGKRKKPIVTKSAPPPTKLKEDPTDGYSGYTSDFEADSSGEEGGIKPKVYTTPAITTKPVTTDDTIGHYQKIFEESPENQVKDLVVTTTTADDKIGGQYQKHFEETPENQVKDLVALTISTSLNEIMEEADTQTLSLDIH